MRYENARLAHAALMKFYPLTLDDLDGEEWEEIGYDEKHYQISTFGRIKSFFNGKMKILSPYVDRDGYLQVTLSKNGRHKKFKVHRLVGEAFIPNPEGKSEINHKFGNKMDNFVENLEWTTHVENDRHALETGLKKSGEEHQNAQFTNALVEWCREVHIPGDKEYGTNALARKLGVSRSCMYLILSGKTYKNAGGGKKSEGDDKK